VRARVKSRLTLVSHGLSADLTLGLDRVYICIDPTFWDVDLRGRGVPDSLGSKMGFRKRVLF
jgi:hypothetical protein